MIQQLKFFQYLFRLNPRYNISRCFYDVRSKNDTIFAPATTISSNSNGSPVGVIRISGSLTKNLITRFTNLSPVLNEDNKGNIKKIISPRNATLAKIRNPRKSSEVIDVGLVIWFPEQNSYTGEDVCEFHLHGSHAIMKNLLHLLGQTNGVRPAEPGEFTRRAVMNKKMSLVQAESLPDLIASRTEKQRKFALRGLEGFVIKKYDSWLTELVTILAHLEASIDFGEDELIGEVQVVNECILKLNQFSSQLEEYIRRQKQSSNYIRNGFKIAIMGKPNVGKSSLMNKLCQRERSIVSDICGTTRDIIEQSFELGGHSLTLCDTAGLRNFDDVLAKTRHDLIEQEGIKRALAEGSKANVIIYVIDVEDLMNSQDNIIGLSDDIRSLLDKIWSSSSREASSNPDDTKIVQLVLNKIDLRESHHDKFAQLFNQLERCLKDQISDSSFCINKSMISCKTDKNFENLIQELSHQLDSLDNSEAEGLEFVNERHLALLESCQRNVHEASKLSLTSIDRMAQHVRDATDYLSRCLGTVSNEQVLDVIFRDFCIGK